MEITVKYWIGTNQVRGVAYDYADAMDIASRNSNASQPTFWTEDGEQLHDNGFCLVTESEIDRHASEPTTALRAYA